MADINKITDNFTFKKYYILYCAFLKLHSLENNNLVNKGL